MQESPYQSEHPMRDHAWSRFTGGWAECEDPWSTSTRTSTYAPKTSTSCSTSDSWWAPHDSGGHLGWTARSMHFQTLKHEYMSTSPRWQSLGDGHCSDTLTPDIPPVWHGAPSTSVFSSIGDDNTWDFLRQGHPARTSTWSKALHQLEEQCQARWLNRPSWRMRCWCRRVLVKHRIVLHAYSGRRRLGNVQFFLDQFNAHKEAFTLHTVAMDVINDPIDGDATNPKTCEFWIQAIAEKFGFFLRGGTAMWVLVESTRHFPEDLWGWKSRSSSWTTHHPHQAASVRETQCKTPGTMATLHR